MNELNDVTRSEKTEKRVWQVPVMEELNVTSTEASYAPSAGSDGVFYTV